ncbi:MAG: phage holin family protein [Oscillospiraceae bacterium]|nr:phage holin family protein [Oscillospiraceae bacterium]
MQYIIMILIVMMLAIADIVTGVIKAYITDRPRSQKMRIGGLHKAAEITVMATACGLEIGIEQLGAYYDTAALAGVVGAFAAFSVFGYITAMEIVSVLENYAEINPDAVWVRKIIKKMKPKEEDET